MLAYGYGNRGPYTLLGRGVNWCLLCRGRFGNINQKISDTHILEVRNVLSGNYPRDICALVHKNIYTH